MPAQRTHAAEPSSSALATKTPNSFPNTLLPLAIKRPHRPRTHHSLTPELAIILITHIHRRQERQEDSRVHGGAGDAEAW